MTWRISASDGEGVRLSYPWSAFSGKLPRPWRERARNESVFDNTGCADGVFRSKDTCPGKLGNPGKAGASPGGPPFGHVKGDCRRRPSVAPADAPPGKHVLPLVAAGTSRRKVMERPVRPHRGACTGRPDVTIRGAQFQTRCEQLDDLVGILSAIGQHVLANRPGRSLRD